ncbi:MAG: nitroreductase/quinone reductase family protein [Acidimicrobiales bacterium]
MTGRPPRRVGPAGSTGEGPAQSSRSRGVQDFLSGLFQPVDYARRSHYRPPPALYRRLQWIGLRTTALGLSPRDVVVLEVPGRVSGVIRGTVLVRVVHGGEHHLVALAGESEWVRNARAAQGRVVIGRKQRHAAVLVEVPPPDRAPVIRAYLFRWGRQAGATAVAKEASSFFGVGADASLEEIEAVVEHYPVFRVEYGGRGDTRRGWGK